MSFPSKGWEVSGDRVTQASEAGILGRRVIGAAVRSDPFYTIRIDAVWPSSDGAEKVIIRPDTDLSRSFAIGQYDCNRVA